MLLTLKLVCNCGAVTEFTVDRKTLDTLNVECSVCGSEIRWRLMPVTDPILVFRDTPRGWRVLTYRLVDNGYGHIHNYCAMVSNREFTADGALRYAKQYAKHHPGCIVDERGLHLRRNWNCPTCGQLLRVTTYCTVCHKHKGVEIGHWW